MLSDLSRFTLEFFPPMNTAALHVYYSALSFAPTHSLVRKYFVKELKDSVRVINGIKPSWSHCIRIMKGHSSTVECVSFSPDGKLIASGSYDSTIRVWDTVTGVTLKTLNSHLRRVFSVCFSPDGKLIVSGSIDSIIRVWDTLTGVTLKTLKGHLFSVHSVCFSPDGKLIASGSDDETIRVWDTVTGSAFKTLNGHSSIVTSISLSRHSSVVTSISFSSDERLIESCDNDGTTLLWDVVSGARVWKPNYQMQRYFNPRTDFRCQADGWVVQRTEGHVKKICWVHSALRPTSDNTPQASAMHFHLKVTL
jgi:WD40 repeat protein